MSRVPELIDATVAALRADPALAGVGVLDGAEVSGEKASDWVLVGYDGDADGDFVAAESESGWSDMAGGRSESITVPVALVSVRGDTDIRAARVRVYEMADAVAALLRANRSLGLASTQVAIGRSSLRTPQTTDGAQALLRLDLTADTFSL